MFIMNLKKTNKDGDPLQLAVDLLEQAVQTGI